MIEVMPRWDPDAGSRLQEAALELYARQGFDETTVAEIAERAGLTERTFFRHFTDKREVLFAGSRQLEQSIVTGVAEAPESATPIEAVATGIKAAGAFFNADRRDYARKRQGIISANTELRERELTKLASLGSAMVDTLRRRGVPERAASLTAEVGMGVFRVTFERWIDAANGQDWSTLVEDSLAHLKKLIGTR